MKFKFLNIYEHCLLFCMVLLFTSSGLFAQKFHSDNGDGTFTNPVIPADFPDPDVIRVGDTYYMVTTTMFIFPGVTVLKSKDLVNWQYCSNAVPRFDYGKSYNLDGGNRYGHGQWATSLKYNNGKFYLLFITLNEGGFICSADKAEGPWEIKQLPKGFYDPGLFFDTDGKIYVAHGYGKIFMTELNKDFSPAGKDSLVFTGDIKGGLEGTHVYKIGDLYYLYCTYGGPRGIQVAMRSKNIYGPYTEKVVLQDTVKGPTLGMHQGALIQTRTGEWWTMLFVDSGPLGRFPFLQPVNWIDGWPIVGSDGHGVITYKKPNVGTKYPVATLPTSDQFDHNEFGKQWGWNHNPDAAKWSLIERPGYLRLKTVRVCDSLPKAVNTLTQRIFSKYDRSKPTYCTTKLDVRSMKDGDVAGLAIFEMPYGYIGVKVSGDKKYLVMVNDGEMMDSAVLKENSITLRSVVSNAKATADFEYSFDNVNFTKLGNTLNMKFNLKIFTGNKVCLFNYPTKGLGGFVDFDELIMN